MGAIPCLPACLGQNLLVVYSRILQTSRPAGTALGVSGNSLVSAPRFSTLALGLQMQAPAPDLM